VSFPVGDHARRADHPQRNLPRAAATELADRRRQLLPVGTHHTAAGQSY
jgi:hypothetical protein